MLNEKSHTIEWWILLFSFIDAETSSIRITYGFYFFQTDVKKGIDAMKSLLHIVIIVGSVIFIFAIPYSPLAITIYGGTMLVSNSGKLRWSV